MKIKIFIICLFVTLQSQIVFALPNILKYTPIEDAANVLVGTALLVPSLIGGLGENVDVTQVDLVTGEVVLVPEEDCNGDGLGNLISSNGNLVAHYWNGGNVKPSGWATQNNFSSLPASQLQASLDAVNSQGDFCVYSVQATNPCVFYMTCYTDGVNANYNDQFYNQSGVDPEFTIFDLPNGLGNVAQGTIGGVPVELYDFLEDLTPPEPTCFDGIMNQDETGIDCGGICATNYGLVCSVADSCFDGIMNQDETGVDCGGVCMPCVVLEDVPNDDPVPQTIVDANNDGIDDITGYDPANPTITGGTLPAVDPGFYNTTLPGTVADVGETDWGELIMSSLSANPLIALATGTTINLTNAECTLTGVIYGKNIEIDFCSLEWMVDIFGVLVLLLFTIRSIFVALGVQ